MKLARTWIAGLALVFSTTAFADTPKKDAPAPTKKDEPKKDDKKAPPATKSLYDRLGGKDAITKVVHEFLGNVVADKVINKRFAKTDAKKLEGLLVDQVCEATGGPCKYKGKSMKDAHKGMKVTEEEFNALVGDLVKALDKFKVGDTEKKELLGALGGMKGDIVEAAAPAKKDEKPAPKKDEKPAPTTPKK